MLGRKRNTPNNQNNQNYNNSNRRTQGAHEPKNFRNNSYENEQGKYFIYFYKRKS